jgi:hypothetical protein
LAGEPAVYEELFHLASDPEEVRNLAQTPDHTAGLTAMRAVWKRAIIQARGTGKPRVIRYTSDSEAERGVLIEPK